MKNVSRISMLFLAMVSFSVEAKTFRFTNKETGQSMTVHCFFPQSVQCQQKKDEVIKRLTQGTNPQSSTLTGARASDFGSNVKNSALSTGSSIKDGAVNVAGDVKDGAVNMAGDVKDGAVDLGVKAVDGAVGLGSAIGNTASRAFDSVRDGASQAAAAIGGKTYRVKVPGYEHSMTFHCRGGLESKECQEEKNIVVAAIKGGSEAKTLEEFRLSPLYRAKDAVVGATERVVDGTKSVISRESHNYCKRKLERHAKDFDEKYERTETQLVSYEEKLLYIEDKLVEEGKMEACQEHFDNAVLGYQLKWIQRGEVAQEKTHIFDGLGRLADGGVGYWKQEERRGYSSSASAL